MQAVFAMLPLLVLILGAPATNAPALAVPTNDPFPVWCEGVTPTGPNPDDDCKGHTPSCVINFGKGFECRKLSFPNCRCVV